MYVKVTEDHLNKSVKAGTLQSQTRNPIARALRLCGYEKTRVTEYYINAKGLDAITSPAVVKEFMKTTYRYYFSSRLVQAEKLKKLRFMLPFNMRVPKPDNAKKK